MQFNSSSDVRLCFVPEKRIHMAHLSGRPKLSFLLGNSKTPLSILHPRKVWSKHLGTLLVADLGVEHAAFHHNSSHKNSRDLQIWPTRAFGAPV